MSQPINEEWHVHRSFVSGNIEAKWNPVPGIEYLAMRDEVGNGIAKCESCDWLLEVSPEDGSVDLQAACHHHFYEVVQKTKAENQDSSNPKFKSSRAYDDLMDDLTSRILKIKEAIEEGAKLMDEIMTELKEVNKK